MLQRCTNPKNTSYHNYGGRGISVCERWNSFSLFLLDMGERPEGRTLDRIDNNGNYEPSNCRWATKKEQGYNRNTTKSSPELIIKIQEAYKLTNFSTWELAKQFNCSQNLIFRAIHTKVT